MRKALYILGHLSDADVQWMARAGRRRTLRAGEVIIHEGHPIDAMFLTLEGAMVVTLADAEPLARLGAGELVGEIAFVDSAPPTATVVAEAGAVVLEIKASDLKAKIATDVGFAARFYKALAIFLADRLRRTTRRLGYGKVGDLDKDEILDDELDPGVLDHVADAGERFTRLVASLGSS